MAVLTIAAALQAVVLTAGILLNLLLLYIILRYTKKNVGFYKWLMASFCFYEFTYGLVALLVMPIHFVGYRSWISFSYNGPLSETSLATDFTSLYCMLYGSWLGFVFCNYIYRYLSLCKAHWLDFAAEHLWMRLILFASFGFFLFLTTYCAFYSCRVHHPTKESLEYIRDTFGLEYENMSYIMVRIQDPLTGEVSPYGILSIVIHSTFLLAWLSCIGYCCIKIYFKIVSLHSLNGSIKVNIAVEKQLFYVLLLQTVIPLVFCDIPSIIHFTFPLWAKTAFFTQISPFFTLSSSVPKLLDPLVSLLCIKAYRCAVKRMMGIDNSVSGSPNIQFLSSEVQPDMHSVVNHSSKIVEPKSRNDNL